VTIDSEDFRTFFEVAFDVTDMSGLKCFKCGERLEEKEDLSGVTCKNAHEVGYLEYMSQYANMLKDFFDNAEITENFQKKVITPTSVLYCGNNVLFAKKNILRSL